MVAAEIHVPELGESVADATVGRWLKQEGDAVTSGEALVELETDKINFEVEAEQDGVLESISKGEGETVNVGEVIGTIGEGSEAGDGASSREDGRGGSAEEAATRGARPSREARGRGTAERRAQGGRGRCRACLAFGQEAGPGVRGGSGRGHRFSGSGGRITRDDVERLIRSPVQHRRPARRAPEAPERRRQGRSAAGRLGGRTGEPARSGCASPAGARPSPSDSSSRSRRRPCSPPSTRRT